jgi:hypothetical protein
MKYWQELTNIECEIIRLDAVKSLLTVVCNGMENTSKIEDIENSMWHILGSIEDIKDKQYETFQELFDMIKQEDTGISTLKTNEYIAPKNTELDAIVRGWILNA